MKRMRNGPGMAPAIAVWTREGRARYRMPQGHRQAQNPTGIPLVYELSDDLKPVSHAYLGDSEQAKKAAEAAASQGSAQH